MDGIFRAQLSACQRQRIEAACVDLWQPFKASIHIMRHAKRQQLNQLFAPNRKIMKAYLLKESLERLWTYTHQGAMFRYLKNRTLQLRWQRLPAFEKLARMPMDPVDGILNYCRVKVRVGVVDAINGNIKSIPRRGRGYKNPRYLLLKAQRMAATKTEFAVLRKAS